jgi:hypothetical protein
LGEGASYDAIGNQSVRGKATYDTRSAVDVRRGTLEYPEAFEDLMQREDEIGEDPSVSQIETERDALDRVILEAMGLEERFEEIKQAVTDLLTMREDEAGKTQVLVERVEGQEVVDLAGVSNARESATLSDYE